ncbi:MAG TPA: RNA 2',3'-cyclic phosphodiesterase [Candidatus Saccharimonadales bacterium]|nr:RNA 2',3'-cyclic phosphodiesterase [Candidatus Saccharimonadales bacterium]
MNERYFIAISLPKDVSRHIEAIQKEILEGHPVMKPFQPHITLVPPNVLDSLPVETYVPRFKTVAQHYLPISIKLARTRTFENRVLYIEVEGPELINLQSELMKLLPQAAIDKSNRDFVPHVTLAQAKPNQELADELKNRLNFKIEAILPYKFTAEYISKFKWLKPRTYEDNAI